MTDNAIFTDIPTLGNHYTGDGPPTAPSFYMKRAGGYDGSRLFAPAVDGGPDGARVLALGTLPSDFGEYSNGLIMVYSAFLYDETLVAVNSGNQFQHQYLYRKAPGPGGELPIGALGTLVRRVVRAAVHKPVSDPSGYATGWQVIEGFGWRNGAPRSTDPTPWTDASVPGADLVSFALATWNEIHPYNVSPKAIFPPSVVQITAQRNGPNVFIFVPHDGTLNYSRSYSDSNRFNGMYHLRSDLSVSYIPMNGKHLFHTPVSDWLGYPNWESYFYYGVNVYVDESTDPTFFFLSHTMTQLLGFPVDYRTLAMTVKLSELVSGSAEVPSTPINDGLWRGSGRVGASMHSVPGALASVKNGLNTSADVIVTGQAVRSWAVGNGPPELWFFVPKSMEQGSTLYDGGGDVDNWSVTFDIYKSSYGHGNLTPAMTFNATTPIVLTDDTAYSSGGAQFPAQNPQGLAFDPDWFNDAHKHGTLTLSNLEDAFDVPHQHFPIGIPTSFFVTRNPAKSNQLVLACRATKFETYDSFGGVAELGGVPGVLSPSANGTPYTLTQIWTAISNDDGVTWKAQRISKPPFAEDINSTPPSYGELYWLDGYGMEPLGNGDIAQSRFTLDSAGRIVMGLTDSKIYYDKGTGMPVSFWNAPRDAGLHHGLFFPQGTGTSGAKTGATDVKFKRTQRR